LVASSTKIPGEYPVFDFSTAESDAAATLFGCDCPSCIRGLASVTQSILAEQRSRALLVIPTTTGIQARNTKSSTDFRS
jgi:hypothetical protein